MSETNHALIFGASGVSGWGTLVQALSYPSKTTFASITGLTNRPLTKQQALLPDDDRLSLVSGVNLAAPIKDVIASLQANVPNIGSVTHVFFYAYIHAPEGDSQFDANTRLVDHALIALKELSPNLKHFVLQTGGKTYAGAGPAYAPPQPWKESDARSKHPELSENVFYYGQVNTVKKHAEGASWTWSEIVPDAIIGFAPTSTAMNIGRSLGTYLALWRKVHGPGSKVPYPGNKAAWTALNTISPMGSIARLAIFTALNGGKSNGEAYNITEEEPTTFEQRWHRLVALFGLVGVPPTESPLEPGLPAFTGTHKDALEWANAHADAWLELEKEHNLKPGSLEGAGFDFFDISLILPVDHTYDNTKRFEQLGFDEKVDVYSAFEEAWKDFARAGYLPPL